MHGFDPQVLKFIPPERIAEHLKKLHPGMVVTQGYHESLVPGYINDLEWNFYDEIHRNFVHNTYHGMYKVMTGNYFSVNIVRWQNLPLFLQVANAKIDHNLFYQCMTVMGILCLHQVQRLIQKDDHVLIKVDWYTASHWLFRFLHGAFNKRLLKLQKKQDQEDNTEIRARRFDLRCKGFSFSTDNPNFVNSNCLTNNVYLPPLTESVNLFLKDYIPGQTYRVECGPVELMLCRHDENRVELWPAICPHEGALMDERHLCNKVMSCPWHGRTFPGVVLDNKNKTQWKFLSVNINHRGDHLEISPQEQAKQRKLSIESN